MSLFKDISLLLIIINIFYLTCQHSSIYSAKIWIFTIWFLYKRHIARLSQLPATALSCLLEMDLRTLPYFFLPIELFWKKEEETRHFLKKNKPSFINHVNYFTLWLKQWFEECGQPRNHGLTIHLHPGSNNQFFKKGDNLPKNNKYWQSKDNTNNVESTWQIVNSMHVNKIVEGCRQKWSYWFQKSFHTGDFSYFVRFNMLG